MDAGIRDSSCENGRSIARRRDESDLEALGYESLRSSILQTQVKADQTRSMTA